MAQKDEQIGFHKGSLTTLVKERQEFLKMINLIEVHMKALKDLGVDLEKESKKSKLDDKLK